MPKLASAPSVAHRRVRHRDRLAERQAILAPMTPGPSQLHRVEQFPLSLNEAMHPLLLTTDGSGMRGTRAVPGQTGLMAGWGVFQHYCVSQLCWFAYERHFERMRFDAAALHVPFPVATARLGCNRAC